MTVLDRATGASTDLGAERPADPALPGGRPARPRRLRRTAAMRALVRETRLHPKMLVAPMFVRPGSGVRERIASLPGVERVSPDEAVRDAERYARLGLGGVLLFGLPESKDPSGSAAWVDDGIVQVALRRLRQAQLPLVLVADTCLCEYTSHGHCGPVTPDGAVDNDVALAALARTAAAQAAAGADVVAPSAMMDGQVAAIGRALDEADFHSTALLAYAAKTASAFYGPFREAADSAPAFGDRWTYQMDPANGREALRELALDAAEGADMLMVKPALPMLDVIAVARERFDVPIWAYQVSGEHAMLAAAAQNGWLDGRRAMLEALTGIVRAGAQVVVSYAAADVAGWLGEDSK
jgi:porphobilinogen synthase